MSLVPASSSLLLRDWWDDWDRSLRLIDWDLRDPWRPLSWRPWRRWYHDRIERQQVITRSWVESDKDKFQVSIDVSDFSGNEIIVRSCGQSIIVEAKHEERRWDNSYLVKEFSRRYDLPKGHDLGHVACKLSSDGVLTISAPKYSFPCLGDRVIPIRRTYLPALKY